jgi:hypothetical protein
MRGESSTRMQQARSGSVRVKQLENTSHIQLPGSEPTPVAILQAWPKEQTLLQVSRAVIALQDLSFASRASEKNWR